MLTPEEIARLFTRRSVLAERTKDQVLIDVERRSAGIERAIISAINKHGFNGRSTRRAATLRRTVNEIVSERGTRLKNELEKNIASVQAGEIAFLQRVHGLASEDDAAEIGPQEPSVDGIGLEETLLASLSALAAISRGYITRGISDDLSLGELTDSIRAEVFPRRRNALKSNAATLYQDARTRAIEEFARKNKGQIPYLEAFATLDDVTSDICWNLDGKLRPANPRDGWGDVPVRMRLPARGSKPPFHRYCRTILIPIYRDSPVAAELKNKDASIESVAALRGDVSAESMLKGSGDEFLFGTSFGATRAQLLKEGATLRSLYDKHSRPLTVAELEAKMPAIFDRINDE